MIEIHPIQKKILELAKKASIAGLGLRTIGKMIGEEHPQKIQHHLDQLIKKGLLDSSLAPTRKSQKVSESDLLSIPILGAANCGPANTVAEQKIEGYIQISKKIIGTRKKVFSIRAMGHSMDRARINGHAVANGDYVLVDPNYKVFSNGDYVLSVIDGMANIKKLLIDKVHQRIVLQSESDQHIPPILIDPSDSYLINGKVFEVIKNN